MVFPCIPSPVRRLCRLSAMVAFPLLHRMPPSKRTLLHRYLYHMYFYRLFFLMFPIIFADLLLVKP